jgi:hypothetical protein
VQDQINAHDIDAVRAQLVELLEAEHEALLRDTEYLQLCLEEETDAACDETLAAPTVGELSELGCELRSVVRDAEQRVDHHHRVCVCSPVAHTCDHATGGWAHSFPRVWQLRPRALRAWRSVSSSAIHAAQVHRMLAAEEKAEGRVGRLRSLVGSSRDDSGQLTKSCPTPSWAPEPVEPVAGGGRDGTTMGSAHTAEVWTAEASSIPAPSLVAGRPLSARRRGGGGSGGALSASAGSLTTIPLTSASFSAASSSSSSSSYVPSGTLRPSAPSRPPLSADRPHSPKVRRDLLGHTPRSITQWSASA